MTTSNKYTPDFKCSSDGNNKGVVNASVGLLNYDEVVYAGGYPFQDNNNYYLNNSAIYWWTMSPAGFTGSGSGPYVWSVSATSTINGNNVRATVAVRPVLNLTADTLATGSGTSSDPFVRS